MLRFYNALALSKKAKNLFQIPNDMKILANQWSYSKNLLFLGDFSDFFKDQKKGMKEMTYGIGSNT